MKFFILSVSCLSFLGLGYFIGHSNSPKVEILKQREVIETSSRTSGGDQIYEGDLFEVEDQKSEQGQKAKLTRKQRKEKLEKHLNYLVEKAPFSLVKKIYQNREKALDKAAFGNYEIAEFDDDERRKDFEKETFQSIVPAIERSFQYRAEGTFEYKGHSIPYKLDVSLSNPWRGSEKKKSVPQEPKDFSYMVLLNFDTSSVGFGDDKFSLGSGAGLFNVVRESGRVFLKEYVYYSSKDTIFNDILYILVEAPGRDGEFAGLRLFDSSTSKWFEVTDRVSWRPISEEAFKEAKKSMWGRDVD